MPQSFSVPRLLINRLRNVMAGDMEADTRLQKVVTLIAGTMVADVCSIYRRTDDDELELVATEGLSREAVHQTKLALDEGLVGQIALSGEPLSIQDAPRHPAFSYRPETGEDPYHAFLGVPILRGGRVIGVLTVQNRTERLYEDDEVDSLQTIAMVLAEVVAAEATTSGGSSPVREARSITLSGRTLCDGLGLGEARLHDVVVSPARYFTEDPDAEAARLRRALKELNAQLDRMLASDVGAIFGEPREVLEAFKMLASDPVWPIRLEEAVRSGLSAEAAVDRSRREHRTKLENAHDPYLRERLHDLEDLDNRLLRVLSGSMKSHANGRDRSEEVREVLIARRLGPAELLEYRDSGLAAIILEEVAPSSHTAIVARAMGIPTIGGVGGLSALVAPGDQVIVDAEQGTLHIRPDQSLLDAYQTRSVLRTERQAAFQALRDQPSRTRDGVDIKLMLNAGLAIDLESMDATGADGIGLFRTEFQFLVSDTLPKMEAQIDLYREVLDHAGSRPVHFRTLDLGGDKLLPNATDQFEENPALGWRSIRFALDRPGLFRRQLRALVRAADGGPLSVMFPMVTIAEEFFEAKALLLDEIEWSKQRGFAEPIELRVGAMLEAPAFAYGLEDVAGEVDFISVGTNDLLQFFHAADRMVPRVSERYDLVSRPVMRFLEFTLNECNRLGIPVSVCGEVASRPVEALCLLGLGFRTLSMPAAGIGPVKRMLRSLDLGAFSEALKTAVHTSNGEFRNEVLAIAELQKIVLTDS
ncbi:phosphoenolpyruvate--protein phosphotransferase [Henriciella pelagia]|jgi:phosphotransferase system, enzyme I, PtsP|uniref:phosphoenolpyruvate--protein phosphotransferase n=3 Tax=Henriciella pelagia TaxID=1977912 RepID=A0ABQ1JW71_9PROT|nr:phosphoenolpyruvate--protein phosphotransferase [Henriciella pelagia]GGB76233.1 phosphoenolpyruvate--protein phosphotransferase [Henriciella pelagia]